MTTPTKDPSTTPNSARLFAALEAGWPAAASRNLGPFRLRQSPGGGQRVVATTVEAPFTETDLARALAEMRASVQSQVFQIQPSLSASAALDRLLAARGWREHDPVSLYLGRTAPLAERPLPNDAAFTVWPPMAIQREIWAANHIGPDRLDVMARADLPRASLLARLHDRAVGAAYVAVSDGIAGLHALVIDPSYRRQGAARYLMQRAARWAQEQGADWLALAVTRQNGAARALYTSLGMTEVEHYHYRIPLEADV